MARIQRLDHFTGFWILYIVIINVQWITPVSVNGQVGSTEDAQTAWSAEEFPNPQSDPKACGQRGPVNYTWTCDPNNVLNDTQVYLIEVAIDDTMLTNNTGCVCKDYPCGVHSGYKMAMAVVPRIRYHSGGYPDSDNEKLDATKYFAQYLKGVSWKYGICDEDLVLMVSKEDKKVWTVTGTKVRETLTDNCVTDIFEENEDLLHSSTGEGVVSIISEYRAVLLGARTCSSSGGWEWLWLLVIIPCTLIVVACILCYFENRRGESKKCLSRTSSILLYVAAILFFSIGLSIMIMIIKDG